MTNAPIKTTVDDPFVIENPRLGFLNLFGETARHLVESDRVAIGDLFQSVEVAENAVPTCNVVFIYCPLVSSGRLPGGRFSFRDVIATTGAHVAVMASELPSELLNSAEFGKALVQPHGWPANVVLTGNRNGEHFGQFFRSLFSLMLQGVTMPLAWVQLAPQGPQQRNDIPGTIFLPIGGHIAFKKKRAAVSDIRVTSKDRF